MNNTEWFRKIDSSNGAVFFSSGVFYYFVTEQVKALVQAMAEAVSYTHLDVYKRQVYGCGHGKPEKHGMVCLPKSGLNDFVRKTESKDENKQMKDKKLLFDRKSHVLYSKPCKKEIQAKIALHYPEAERETVWEKVQRQYVVFLSVWRTDLGGKKNFHNGVGGTYDCIAIMSYYVVCKAVTSFREIEEMEENLILPTFRKLKFVDCNKPFWRKLMYRAFVRAKSG